MEDNEIIRLFFARDENAIRQTEEKYSRYLHKIALNILNSDEDSRECVNDTYLRAWNAIPPDMPKTLSYYLGKITRRLSIDRLRRKTSAKRGRSEYELSLDELEECIPAGDDPAMSAEASLLAELIGKYLKGCSKEARRIFICRYYFCDSIREISAYSGCSESKLKSMLLRTREGLKKYLEKEGYSL